MEFDLRLPRADEERLARFDRLRRWTPPVPRARLESLEEAARIAATAASCRLAGFRLTDEEVARLLAGKRRAVGSIREVPAYGLALRRELVPAGEALGQEHLGRLHARLADPAAEEEPVSPWRRGPHLREAFSAEGVAVGRVFATLPPHLIEPEMERLLAWYEIETRSRRCHPVLAVGIFTLGFLAACPFPALNGRMSRILLPLLLRHAGFAYVDWAPIEAEIETLRDDYHETFDRSQAQFWSGGAQLGPWIAFLLEVLTRHADRVEAQLAPGPEAFALPPLQQAILATVRRHEPAGAGQILEATGANRNTLKDNLRKLVDAGLLERTGQRRGTRYRLGVAARAGRPVGDS